MTDNLKLLSINEKDYEFLYKLLSERKQITFISHKKMPTYEEHVKFIESEPYSKWYIIQIDDKKIGSIYLTKENEIGIFLKEDIQRRGIGSNALNELININPGLRYLANINPKNDKSIEFFKKSGFKLIQYTYELNV